MPSPGRRAHRRDLLRGRPPSTSTSCRPSVEAGHVHQGDDDIPAWVQVASGHVAPVWERLWERRLELGANTYRVLVPRASTELDKIFDQALILWCGMVTCGRAGIPVLGRDMGALGFKFPTTHRAYGGAGSELRRAEGGMVRSSEGTQRRSFSSLG